MIGTKSLTTGVYADNEYGIYGVGVTVCFQTDQALLVQVARNLREKRPTDTTGSNTKEEGITDQGGKAIFDAIDVIFPPGDYVLQDVHGIRFKTLAVAANLFVVVQFVEDPKVVSFSPNV